MSPEFENPLALSARRRVTRERLLDAAAEVFAEEGVQSASVESICARANFTRGAFYSNFDSKEQLFLELLQREFARRAQYIQEQAATAEPLLRMRDGELTAADASRTISEFFLFEFTNPDGDIAAWFTLETEFLLLAMRDPAIAPEYHRYTEGFYSEISEVVDSIVAAAGRRFVIPVERALPILGGLYERALRNSALAGIDAAGGRNELGIDLAELLFVLTEERGE